MMREIIDRLRRAAVGNFPVALTSHEAGEMVRQLQDISNTIECSLTSNEPCQCLHAIDSKLKGWLAP
jgi:hypothetical protein